MASTDPFAVLEIAPTLDAAQVKRAYFAQLKKHAPHADPEGFRQLRAAYEALMAPGALPLAFLAAPLDAPKELAAWRERWDLPVRQAADRARTAGQEAHAVEAFVATVSRLSLVEAVSRFGEEGPYGRAPGG